jgi:hypothetical protein
MINNFINVYSDFDANLCELTVYSDEITLTIDNNLTKVVYKLGYGYIANSLQLDIYTRPTTKVDYSLYDVVCGTFDDTRFKMSYQIKSLYFDVKNSGHGNQYSINAK